MLRGMISRYYFLDWFAMALAARDRCSATRPPRLRPARDLERMLGRGRPVGTQPAIALGNAAFLAINLRGWWRWQAGDTDERSH
jgi:hypothetical protein